MNDVADRPAAPLLQCRALSKRFSEGRLDVTVLQGVDLDVRRGETLAIVGASGSGKSTLLKCLGAVIDPTAGRMTLGDEVIYDEDWKVRDLRALRRDKIGFVFQAPYLIPFLDVTDNVALLDEIRARVGDDPFQWLPLLRREVQDRKTRTSRRAA